MSEKKAQASPSCADEWRGYESSKRGIIVKKDSCHYRGNSRGKDSMHCIVEKSEPSAIR